MGMTETGPKPKHSKNGRKNYLNWSGPKAMKKEKEKKKGQLSCDISAAAF